MYDSWKKTPSLFPVVKVPFLTLSQKKLKEKFVKFKVLGVFVTWHPGDDDEDNDGHSQQLSFRCGKNLLCSVLSNPKFTKSGTNIICTGGRLLRTLAGTRRAPGHFHQIYKWCFSCQKQKKKIGPKKAPTNSPPIKLQNVAQVLQEMINVGLPVINKFGSCRNNQKRR